MYLAMKPSNRAIGSATHVWYAPTTERRSSGSSLVDSAVEPTRSVNITVSWRPSASSLRVSSVATGAGGAGCGNSRAAKIADCAKNFQPMAERNATRRGIGD